MSDSANDNGVYDIRIGETIPSANSALSFLAQGGGGGNVLFSGTTRRFTGGKETVSLTYEAHVPLAEAECARMLHEAAVRWPVLRALVWHRLGDVPVSEVSILIGVATVHRQPAFEACNWLINTLKRRIPVWKKEAFSSGSSSWHEGSW